jgi:hypothetical protein
MRRLRIYATHEKELYVMAEYTVFSPIDVSFWVGDLCVYRCPDKFFQKVEICYLK